LVIRLDVAGDLCRAKTRGNPRSEVIARSYAVGNACVPGETSMIPQWETSNIHDVGRQVSHV
jgi:hypothetical protein